MRFDVAGIDDAGDGSQSSAAALRGSRCVGWDEGLGINAISVDDVPVEYVLRLQLVVLLFHSPCHEIGEDEGVLRVRGQAGMGSSRATKSGIGLVDMTILDPGWLASSVALSAWSFQTCLGLQIVVSGSWAL